MSKLLLVLSLLLVCVSAHGASFNCSLAKSRIEKLICSNAELSRADEELSKSYNDMKKQARKPDLLIKNQLEWLKHRDECKEESCLISEYKIRNTFINNWLEYENKTLPKPGGKVQCSDRPECWPEGSAMHTGLLLREKQQKLQMKLQEKYKELVELISLKKEYKGREYLADERLVRAVENQQTAWKEYKDKECELIGALSGGASTWQSVRSQNCARNLTEQRLRRMSDAVECIKRINPKERRFKLQKCLYQIAPLAVPLGNQP